jgi:cystathionine beta-lyase
MSQPNGLNRRAFLRNAGLTALAGAAAGTHAPLLAATADAAPAAQASNGTFDFDTVYNRFGTDSTKFDQQIGRYGKDSVQVGMGIADIDFKAAPSITEAINARVKHENWGYLDMDKWTPQMTESVAAWNKRRYGVTIDPKTIILSNGVHPALIAALKTFSPKGSKVLLTTPTYNGFYGDLTASETKAEESPLKFVNGKFQFDFDDFERRISYETNTFILCNPQNPTGNCWSQEDLLKIGEICLKHRVIVLADEIHCDWVSKGQKYTPFASLPEQGRRRQQPHVQGGEQVVRPRGAQDRRGSIRPTRSSGARQAESIAPTSTRSASSPTTAAITDGEEWLRQANEYVSGTHDFVVNFVAGQDSADQGASREGTYLTWLDVTAWQSGSARRSWPDDYNRTKPAEHAGADARSRWSSASS